MNKKEWEKELEKIQKVLADAEEVQFDALFYIRQKLIHERNKIAIEWNDIQKRIDLINNIMVFNTAERKR